MPAPPRYEIGFAWLGTPPRTPRAAPQSAARTPPRRPQTRGLRTSTRAAADGSAELRLGPQLRSHNSVQSRSRAVATSPDQARRNAVLTRAPAHASVRQPLRFEVQARDAHGVALTHGVSDCRMRLRGAAIVPCDSRPSRLSRGATLWARCAPPRAAPWRATGPSRAPRPRRPASGRGTALLLYCPLAALQPVLHCPLAAPRCCPSQAARSRACTSSWRAMGKWRATWRATGVTRRGRPCAPRLSRRPVSRGSASARAFS